MDELGRVRDDTATLLAGTELAAGAAEADTARKTAQMIALVNLDEQTMAVVNRAESR